MELTVGLNHYLTLAAVLFVIGILGIVLNRKSIIVVLMCLELMLLAVNINLVSFSMFLNDLGGQIFSFFIFTVAAAEVSIGLAILTIFYRNRSSAGVDDSNLMKG